MIDIKWLHEGPQEFFLRGMQSRENAHKRNKVKRKEKKAAKRAADLLLRERRGANQEVLRDTSAGSIGSSRNGTDETGHELF